MKIVINSCYGGFGLSPEALLWLYERGYDGKDFCTPVAEWFQESDDHPFSLKKNLDKWKEYLAGPKGQRDAWFITTFTPDEKSVLHLMRDEEARTHPLVIECVETLGKASWGAAAELKIIEIPENIKYEIHEYDGFESVHETHRSWS